MLYKIRCNSMHPLCGASAGYTIEKIVIENSST